MLGAKIRREASPFVATGRAARVSGGTPQSPSNVVTLCRAFHNSDHLWIYDGMEMQRSTRWNSNISPMRPWWRQVLLIGWKVCLLTRTLPLRKAASGCDLYRTSCWRPLHNRRVRRHVHGWKVEL